MDRRQFFKFGLAGFRDAAIESAPGIVKPVLKRRTLDLSILTQRPEAAESLCEELLRSHFGERMLRLKQSRFEGTFPGGIVLYENGVCRDHRSGISLLDGLLVQLEKELGIPSPQAGPTLVRFVNLTPPMSRNVEIFHKDRLVMTVPLAEDGEFELAGSCGGMIFQIVKGRFSVLASECKHRTCEGFPPIFTPGQRIICIPNEVTAAVGALKG